MSDTYALNDHIFAAGRRGRRVDVAAIVQMYTRWNMPKNQQRIMQSIHRQSSVKGFIV